MLEKYSKSLPTGNNEYYYYQSSKNNLGDNLSKIIEENIITIFVTDSIGNALKGFYCPVTEFSNQIRSSLKIKKIKEILDGLTSFLQLNKETFNTNQLKRNNPC